MKLCDTEIVTFTEGNRSRFCARGTFSSEGGVAVVRYADDGDAVVLTVSDRSLEMKREGKLSAIFRAGERTGMDILAGGSRGTVGVDTETLNVTERGNAIRILLRYRLLFSAGEEKYTLKISIRIISEEE